MRASNLRWKGPQPAPFQPVSRSTCQRRVRRASGGAGTGRRAPRGGRRERREERVPERFARRDGGEGAVHGAVGAPRRDHVARRRAVEDGPQARDVVDVEVVVDDGDSVVVGEAEGVELHELAGAAAAAALQGDAGAELRRRDPVDVAHLDAALREAPRDARVDGLALEVAARHDEDDVDARAPPEGGELEAVAHRGPVVAARPVRLAARRLSCVDIDRWNAPSGENVKPLSLGQFAVDSADFWTDRWISSSSRSTTEERASKH